jgi:putative hemolysin
MDIALILLLILLNSMFALSEIALVSSCGSRLQNLRDEGHPGAAAALRLHSEPSHFPFYDPSGHHHHCHSQRRHR